MRLSELGTGEKGVIVKVLGHGGFRKRIVEMAYIKGNFDLRGKSIMAAGQAARIQDNAEGMDYVEAIADRALKERDLDIREEDMRTRQANAEAERRSREEIEKRKLKLKEKEIDARSKRSDTDRFTSIINKN